jgi:phospholipid transport system substrate-binding protein
MRTLIAGALLLLLAFSTPVVAQTEPALATVQALDNGLLTIMKAKGTEKSRAQSIAPVIDRAFDLPLMTRLTVGPSWTTITPSEQQALVAAFRRMTIAQYSSNFDSWSGESFSIVPQVESRAGDKLVRTTLNAPGKEPVAISYRLRSSGGEWKIIDVFYRNSISQIATRRSDFAAVLAKEGAKGLVAHLDSLAAKGSF